jgi:prepilin-type N-terminal cleavage/methylation domain-containing protein
MKASRQSERPHIARISSREVQRRKAFTMVELLVVLAILALLASSLVPVIAKSRPGTQTSQCMNNLRQLTAAWQMYTDDNNGIIVAAMAMQSSLNPLRRPNWLAGRVDFSTNSSNWNTNTDMVKSPIWSYAGKYPPMFKCPSDKSSVAVNGLNLPRIRSYSMSQVFGTGEWLDGYYSQAPNSWRTYDRASGIVIPARTFVFTQEHPDSINDGAFAVACTGAQPTDPPSSAIIIDLPASLHNSAGTFSFSDGRVEAHRWLGQSIQQPVNNTAYGASFLDFNAGDSWMDVRWMAQNTTVHR